MPSLTIFKESFVQSLRISIASNLKKYIQDEIWADKIGSASSRDLFTSLEVSRLPDLLLPSDNDLKDFENAVLLHKTFLHLTLFQARDPRLWTRLCHVEYWQYMRKRWPAERYLDGEGKKAEGNILERYFVPQSQGRSLIRNGIARLWWSAHLSYRPGSEDPYELTRVLMSSLDITQSVLERSIGRAPGVVTGLLEFLLNHKNELLSGGTENRNKIRHLIKHLNMCGGISVLDFLPPEKIFGMLENEYRISMNE